MKRKLLTFLLAIVMVLSLAPTALAVEDDTDFVPEITAETQVQTELSDEQVPEKGQPKTADQTENTENEPVPQTEDVPVPQDGSSGDPVTITVDITAQSKGTFLCAPQIGVSVSSDLAESYGYTDEVIDGVSALDVLVKIHELKYTDSFNKDTAKNYLVVENLDTVGTCITKVFESTDNFGFMVNNSRENDSSVVNTKIEDKALVEFFFYTNAAADDVYLMFGNYNGSKVYQDFLLYPDLAKSVNMHGYTVSQMGGGSVQIGNKEVQTDVQLCWVNAQTGEKTDIDGAVSKGTLGAVGFNAPGTVADYYLSAYSITGVSIMPLVKVEVIEAPKLESLRLYANEAAADAGENEYKITPDFDGNKLTGYTATVPDYTSSGVQGTFYALAKRPGETTNSASFEFNNRQYSTNYSTGTSWQQNGYSSFQEMTDGIATIYFRDDAGNNKISQYEIAIKRYTTLAGLTVDGAMKSDFDRDTFTYEAYVDDTKSGTSITVKYSPMRNDSYTVTVNGQTVRSGEPCEVTYEWDANGKMEIPIIVTGSNAKNPEKYINSTYTLTLEKMPKEATPFISLQPKSANYSVVDEAVEPLTFMAAASGTMTYQWYKCSSEDKADATAVDGATSASFTPSTTEVSDNWYFCRITNTAQDGKSADTNPARIAVYPDPTPIVTVTTSQEIPNLPAGEYPPVEVTDWQGTVYPKETKGFVLNVGDEAPTFEAQYSSPAEGGTWSYIKWIEGINPSKGDGSVISSNPMQPSTAAADASDKGSWYYFCAEYKFNGKTYTTKSDNIYVYVKLKQENIPTPIVSNQPASAEYILGQKAENMRCSTKYDGFSHKYQWYENTINSNTGGTAIDGATSGSYKPNVSQIGTRYYYCVVTNERQGLTSSVATEPAEITVKPDLTAEIEIPFTGEGTVEAPYELSSTEDFTTLASLCAQGVNFKEKYLLLKNDVTLPADWAGLGGLKPGAVSTEHGANVNPFSGTLDGGENCITIPEGRPGLINYARNATVKNLEVYGEKINGSAVVNVAFLDYGEDGNYNTGCPYPIILENVTLKSGSQTLCSGLVMGSGSGMNEVTVRNCTVENNVTIGYDKGQSGIGSFVGDFNGVVSSCKSYADVYGIGGVGGIAGKKGQSMGSCQVSNCEFYGTVTATGNFVGGILGSGYNSDSAPNTPVATVENCLVAGNVTGSNNVGGIFGGEPSNVNCWGNGAGYVSNNVFFGKVTATAENGISGGIVGYLRSFNKHQGMLNNFYLNTGANSGIGKIEKIIYVDDADYGSDGIDYEFNVDAVCISATADQFKGAETIEDTGKTILGLLNSHESSYKNWMQGEEYPVHNSEPIVYALELSGDYKTTYYTGEELDLSSMVITAKWTNGRADETLNWKSDGVIITGYDKSKHEFQTVTVSYRSATAEFMVKTLLPEIPESNNISVSFTLYGDVLHEGDPTANGGPHTLVNNNLQTWVAKKSYTVNKNATVWDLVKQVLDANGMTYSNPSGNYVESITKDGVTLAEFTNGKYSGWMYTIGGKHSDLGVSEQFLKNGDVVVFHYTDDYTKERDTIAWDPGTTMPSKPSTNPTPSPSTEVTVTPTVTENTASATVDNKVMGDVISSAVESGSGNVTVKVELPSGTDESKMTGVSVELPAASITDLADKTDADLTVEIPFANVTISNNGLAELGKEASKITVTATKSEESGTVIVTVAKDGVKVDKIAGGVTAMLPVEAATSSTIAIIVDEDGKETIVKKSAAIDGKMDVKLNGSATIKIIENAKTFDDVANEWSKDAIDFVSSRELFNGVTATEFKAGNTMTRGMLVTVLHRLEDMPKGGDITFPDVSADAWFADAVAWGAANKIVEGTGDGFKPDESVSRQQLATFLYRYAKMLNAADGSEADLSEFDDSCDIANWAEEAMQWAVGAGIINGKTSDMLDPNGNATRGEVATMLQRFVIMLAK